MPAVAIVGNILNVSAYLIQYQSSFSELTEIDSRGGSQFLTFNFLMAFGGLCSSYGTVVAMTPPGIRSNIVHLKLGDRGSGSSHRCHAQ